MNQSKRNQLPVNLALIEISGPCNGRCRWCTTGLKNRKSQTAGGYMTGELFLKGLLRLLELGWITNDTSIEPYSWGEPFLNPHLNDILKVIADNNFRYHLSTNGSVYRELIPEAFKRMDYFAVSMPGFSQESYDKIHGFNLEHIKENIRKFASFFEQHNAKQKFAINYHAYQFNVGEIEAARRFAGELGIGFVVNMAFIADFCLCEKYFTNTMDYMDLRDAAEQLFLDQYHLEPPFSDENYRCLQWDRLCFDENFNLLPCDFLTSEDSLGNLFTEDPDTLLTARENFGKCSQCIAIGMSPVIMRFGPPRTPTWYYNSILPQLEKAEELERKLAAGSTALSDESAAREAAERALDAARAEVQILRSSTSWRMTEPMRQVADTFKRAFGRGNDK